MKARETVTNFYWKAVCRGQLAKARAAEFLTRKTRGASHFMEVMVMIIVVVALAYVFKDQLIGFITSITTKATTNAEALF